MISLLQGDCLERMNEIPDGSVDMVLCDLPYGITQNKWDSEIATGPLWAQYWRVCKDNAAVVLFAAQPFTSALVMSEPRHFKYDWCWRKPKGTGHLNAKKMPMRDKEDILVFYRKPCLYSPQMEFGEPYKAKPGKAKTRGQDCYGNYKDTREDNTGLRYPKQVIEFPIVERGKKHETQKPVDLLRYLIRTYTKPGENVLDNTMGSGSTAVAAIREGRSFIGIEIDESYFQIARDRVNSEIISDYWGGL